MAEPPRVGALALNAANVRAELERALAADTVTGPEQWAELVRTLDVAISQLTWSRDAASLIAHRGGLSWPAIQGRSGIADATLHARARRFTDREGDR